MDGPTGVALAGIALSMFLGYLSYRTARDAREDAARQAQATRDATVGEARASRLFAERRVAYAPVLGYVYTVSDYVDRTAPFLTFDGAPGPPAFPSDDELRRLNATAALWCTAELLDVLMRLRDAAGKFQGEVMSLDLAHRADINTAEHWAQTQAAREAVRALVREAGDRARADLQA